MPKSDKGNNSVKFLQNFMKSSSGDLHHVSKLYAADIMILAQAVLPIFCSQDCFSTQNDKVGKGR